jgi:hypothetical protein
MMEERMTNARRRMTLAPALLFSALAASAASAGAETTQCTAITTAPYVITTEGAYCLTDDLKVGLATGYAIDIQANNVVLDLNGHRLSNSGGSATGAVGVNANSRQNVTVKNGIVKGFYMGVELNSDLSSIVEHIQAIQCWRIGIYANGQGLIVRDNQVLQTGGSTAFGPGVDITGILVNGPWNRVLRNDVMIVTAEAPGSSAGIKFDGSSSSLAVGNRISGADYAIRSDSTSGPKYRNTLSTGIAVAPYVNGLDAGNNN